MRVFSIGLLVWLTSTVQANSLDLLKIYRHLHQNPELSYQEKETAQFLATTLESLGYEVHTGIGGHGVVALLKNGDGPTVMIRADMDALPVKEQTGLPFASRKTVIQPDGQKVSLMHACGHDVHMTVLLGVAEHMARQRSEWHGTLMLVGQPAEERGGGAKAMLADGLFERFPRPDYNLALHDSASLPAGSIGYTAGYALASVDSIDIDVFGLGGHGAYPHRTKDPVVLASRLVVDLQTIISREINPIAPAVLTVGSIHGGTKHNIIPDRVHLQLTLRAYSKTVRNQIIDALKRLATGLAISAGLPKDRMPVVTVQEDEYTPSTYNHPQLVDFAINTWQHALNDVVIKSVPPVMGGEDFGRFGAVSPPIPSFIFWLGAVPQAQWEKAQKGQSTLPSLHSPFWAPDAKTAIPVGVKAMTVLAKHLFEKQPKFKAN